MQFNVIFSFSLHLPTIYAFVFHFYITRSPEPTELPETVITSHDVIHHDKEYIMAMKAYKVQAFCK